METQVDNRVDKVILIDDEESINYLHKLILKGAGINKGVADFRDADKALEYLQSLKMNEKPLILLDINMPLTNGWDFLKKYSELGLSDHLNSIIVILTSSIDPSDSARARGFEDVKGFRSKPLSIEIVKNIVADYF